jgi:hypothetical protein
MTVKQVIKVDTLTGMSGKYIANKKNIKNAMKHLITLILYGDELEVKRAKTQYEYLKDIAINKSKAMNEKQWNQLNDYYYVNIWL